MKNNHKKITILDPERWYLKFGEKRKHYLQLHASFWSDSDFLALNSDQKVVFLWLLNTCLRFNKPVVNVCLESAYGSLNMSLDLAKDCLSALERNDFIELEIKVRKTRNSQLIEENKKEEKKRKEKKLSTTIQSTLDSILELWNRNAPEFDFPIVRVLNAERKKKLTKALKEFPEVDDWRKIFSVASEKGFTSKDGREFVPNWDYIFRNNNYVKFFEEYDLVFKESEKKSEEVESDVRNYLLNQVM